MIPEHVTIATVNALWIKDLVRYILGHPDQHYWTVQGMGMMRTYFAPSCRLAIWHESLRLDPKPTMIHDHPWDFFSLIVAGHLKNTRYEETHEYQQMNPHTGLCGICGTHKTHERMVVQTIRPGEGMHSLDQEKLVTLRQMDAEFYCTGDAYRQRHDEIHETDFVRTTITILNRDRGERPDTARVFWRAGDVFRSAEPRGATRDEIHRVTIDALKELE